MCTAVDMRGVIFPLVFLKQSFSITVDLNDPPCQQQAHRRVVFTVRDKVKKAILDIIKEVLS